VTLPPLLVIGGPTATGKTELATALAEALAGGGRPAEIIAADSRQVFRGLDIGTAKVSAVDRARVPHHGLDLVEPDARFTVGDFVDHVHRALVGVAERGAVALLVGGTGLYLRAIAEGFDPGALPEDAAVGAALEEELAREGLAPLVERLVATAPILAREIELRNPRRVVRALELALLRGDGPRPAPAGYAGPLLQLRLDLADRDLHDRWIGERARAQFGSGLVEEARALRERFDPALPALSAIGYREAWALLDGSLDLEEAIELDAQRNRAFARRQRTWFRGERATTIERLEAAERPFEAALARLRRFLDTAPVS